MKFRCTHTQTTTEIVEIEITAKTRKAAEKINDDWNIDESKTFCSLEQLKSVKVIGAPEVKHDDYDVSPLKKVA